MRTKVMKNAKPGGYIDLVAETAANLLQHGLSSYRFFLFAELNCS